jgi:alpha-ketoglutarate-dependent taurine dioxygenase
MGLFAAFSAVLSRWTQQHDIIVGTPVAGREHTALENLIGCFINTLALRVGLTGDPTFTTLLGRVRQVTLDAYSHRNAPFQAVVEAAAAGRSAESSLIQVMFTFQNIPSDRTLELKGLDVEPLDLDAPVARRDLTVRIEEIHGELRGVFEYDSSVFDDRTIAVLADRFTAMIATAAAHPETRVAELPWQNDEERRLGELETERAKKNRHDKLKALVRTKPTAIRTAPRQLVEISGELPLVARPTSERVDLAGWLATHRALVEDHLAREGAILWRGFHLANEGDFERLAAALSGSLMPYDEGSTPRKVVSGNVYTSTEYPAAQRIPLHCEMAYSHRWPGRLWFWSRQVAAKGGATPIGRCRAILAAISHRTVERFRANGVMYVRNFTEGLDVPWQVVFRTHDRDAVARYCDRAGMDFEWRPGGKLRTRQIRPALAKHPKTGEEVWFNQAHLFHTSSLDPELRRSLLETLSVDELPRTACYGDGTPIEDEVIAEIRAAHEAATLEFPWQEDDLLLVDNMLVAHGRAPFEGPRRVLVAMAEPLGSDAILRADRSAASLL